MTADSAGWDTVTRFRESSGSINVSPSTRFAGPAGVSNDVHMDRVNPSSEVGNERSSMLSVWRESREGKVVSQSTVGTQTRTISSSGLPARAVYASAALQARARWCRASKSRRVPRCDERLAVSIKMSENADRCTYAAMQGGRGAARANTGTRYVRKQKYTSRETANYCLFTHRPSRRALVR